MKPIDKVAALRKLMQEHQIDAWIVSSSDPHQSEYVAEHWQARAWLSGFTGSAGTVVITANKAGLWTDPRYHIRAEEELTGSGITLYREGLPGVPSYRQWLLNEMNPGDTIGFDGSVMSVQDVGKIERKLQDKAVNFSHQYDFIGRLWEDRPVLPKNPIMLHDIKYAGETRNSKIQRVRKKLGEIECQAQLVTALDEIAWLLNIRGRDVEYNPVAICYLVIMENEVRLFINAEKVPTQVREVLAGDGVEFSNYDDIFSYWEQVPAKTKVLSDPEQTSYKISNLISKTCLIKQAMSVPYAMKAIKNEKEIEGLRQAHIRDGVALVKWMYWLDHQNLERGHTEITLAEKLADFRSRGDNFQGLSFNTISGYQANSAVGHYFPRPETTPVVKPEGILLIDSGGQYLDGTTDITRTISLGRPTYEQKEVFTVVLKGLIHLSEAIFLKGTKGSELDVFARVPLWKQGWNCRHGIGHGIGSFLGVHEGPQKFAPGNKISFEPGMVTTNEPGVYFEGKFGVRLENVLITVPYRDTDFGEFLGFETISLCPIDLDLVEPKLLRSDEIGWLNAYHQVVYQSLVEFMTDDEGSWLHYETRSVPNPWQ
jgi:Xaa-Pro aminopeptidase